MLWRSRLLLLVLLSALSLPAVACRGNKQAPKPQVNEQAVLVCTEACAAHGQCGTLPTAKKAVLTNNGGPAVSLHDRYLPTGTAVQVVEINERQLLPAQGGSPRTADATPFPHLFYRVTVPDGSSTWVSDWCIQKAD